LSYFILEIYNASKIWGLGIGDWGLGPIPNPQSPIPKILKIKKYNYLQLIKISLSFYLLNIYYLIIK